MYWRQSLTVRLDTVGLITNPRLEDLARDLLAEEGYDRIGENVKLISEGLYGAESLEHERRVVYKAEAMEEGTNTRFVVSTRTDDPKELYKFYARRGESENWIKDLKLALKADRLSCHRFMANQFRLLLHAAAYWLMDALRRRLVGAGVKRMRESQNTQSPRLRFRALLTEGSDPSVQRHRA